MHTVLSVGHVAALCLFAQNAEECAVIELRDVFFQLVVQDQLNASRDTLEGAWLHLSTHGWMIMLSACLWIQCVGSIYFVMGTQSITLLHSL